MKALIGIRMDNDMALAVRLLCKERYMQLSEYFGQLVKEDFANGLPHMGNIPKPDNMPEMVKIATGYYEREYDGLAYSFSGEIITDKEMFGIIKKHPCRKFLYIEDIGETE